MGDWAGHGSEEEEEEESRAREARVGQDMSERGR